MPGTAQALQGPSVSINQALSTLKRVPIKNKSYRHPACTLCLAGPWCALSRSKDYDLFIRVAPSSSWRSEQRINKHLLDQRTARTAYAMEGAGLEQSP